MFASKNKKRSPLSSEQHRVPGQSLDEGMHDLAHQMISRYYVAFFFVAFTLVLWGQKFIGVNLDPLIPTCFSGVLVAWGINDFFRIRRKITNYRLGRDGEREVAHQLQELIAKGYCILHDVDTGRGNIDHILVGPAGVYTIETKARSKPMKGSCKISYNANSIRWNHWKPDSHPITQAVAQRNLVMKYLNQKCGREFSVQPLVVCVGWFVEKPENEDDLPVWVLNQKQIQFYLNKSKVTLSQDEIKQVTYHLSRLGVMSRPS